MTRDRRKAFSTVTCLYVGLTHPFGFLLVLVLLIGTGEATAHADSSSVASDVSAGADLFRAACAGCHGRHATGARGPDLTRGTFRHAGDDAALFRVIAMGIPGSAMPAALPMHSEPAVWQLVAYIRSLSHAPAAPPPGGDAAAGKSLFEQRGRCLTCHQVDGHGAHKGPDLSSIGRGRTKTSLRLSLVRPSAEVDPSWWSVRVVDAAGHVYQGRRMDEDTYAVRMLDDRGRLQTFQRSSLRSVERIETSTMPAYATELTTAEIDDLVAYLSTLTRP
jgi:putative heme-binding domain-containing protein